MKKYIYVIALLGVFFGMTSSSMVSYPSVSNTAFKVGEKLRYRVTYGFMDAGEARLEVKATTMKSDITMFLIDEIFMMIIID